MCESGKDGGPEKRVGKGTQKRGCICICISDGMEMKMGYANTKRDSEWAAESGI